MPVIENAHPAGTTCAYCKEYRGVGYQREPPAYCCPRRFSTNKSNGMDLYCWRERGHSGPCAWCEYVVGNYNTHIEYRGNKEPA